MSGSHQAYPIAPREGVACRRCHQRPATYRAVRRGKNPHTQAAKYRCLTCINDEGTYEIMGPEKPPRQPTARPPRKSPFERRRDAELEKLESWSGTAVGGSESPRGAPNG